MNLQNIQFLSILLFIFLGCNTKEDKRIETIEMLSNNDYIIFDTQINDKQGYFLFDTHSSVNVIYKKSWDTLEYKITGITKVNNVDVETVNIDSIVLGSARYYNVEAVVIDDSNDTFKNMSGIIGINIDRKANWILNFEKGIVEIHKTDLNKNRFDYFFKYKVNDRHNRLPYLNAKIDKKDIQLKIDTGYEEELKISEKDFFNENSIYFETKNPAGVFGRQQKKVASFILNELTISNRIFNNIDTEYINETNPLGLNLLGIKFFKKFKEIGIDTQNKKIYFKELI